MQQKSAITKINRSGALLVFPINNCPEPASLWSEFFPRKKMRWEWDESGDNKVGELWHLMKRLSENREVVYSKWYQGRATFFSRDLFRAMLSEFMRAGDLTRGLSGTAGLLLETLEADSPLSTKELKKMTDLRGRDNEPEYSRGLKSLFSRFLVVAYGEVDDGAFPSLAIGATQNLYEDLWNDSKKTSQSQASKILERDLPESSLFRKQFEKVKAEILQQNRD